MSDSILNHPLRVSRSIAGRTLTLENVSFTYPGTDKIFKKQSYGIRGPIASLRLKFWRRGIQDVSSAR